MIKRQPSLFFWHLHSKPFPHNGTKLSIYKRCLVMPSLYTSLIPIGWGCRCSIFTQWFWFRCPIPIISTVGGGFIGRSWSMVTRSRSFITWFSIARGGWGVGWLLIWRSWMAVGWFCAFANFLPNFLRNLLDYYSWDLITHFSWNLYASLLGDFLFHIDRVLGAHCFGKLFALFSWNIYREVLASLVWHLLAFCSGHSFLNLLRNLFTVLFWNLKRTVSVMKSPFQPKKIAKPSLSWDWGKHYFEPFVILLAKQRFSG